MQDPTGTKYNQSRFSTIQYNTIQNSTILYRMNFIMYKMEGKVLILLMPLNPLLKFSKNPISVNAARILDGNGKYFLDGRVAFSAFYSLHF